jgi:hypothetical protein
MIIVRLNGGLGNQLFRYAAGRALAEHHGVELKLDISVFQHNMLRTYELDHFAITAKIATSDEINSLTFENCRAYVRSLKKLSQKIKPYYLRTVYKEPHFHFDSNFFRTNNHVWLSGNWQSNKYFKAITSVIKKEFQIVHTLKDKNLELSKMIQDSNSVCVHIRRGDYVSDTQTHIIHGLCNLNYYTNAIELIKKETDAPHFFVFSDDMTWAKSNLNIGFPTTFIDHNNTKTSYEDFRLMSLCKNHIIANSSFSWWSAWLSEYKDKIVLTPAKWFNSSKRDIKDLIPQEWSKI